MPVFGLIIAIENYPDATGGMATKLNHTNDSAVAFAGWLEKRKGIAPAGTPGFDPKRFFCCAGNDVACRTHGTTRPEILRAVAALISAARDQCEELYVYISGHGFCYPRDELVQEDILVCADFVDTMTGGAASVKVPELIQLLCTSLGPGAQYYFYDACRTEIPFGSVRPADTGLAPPPSQLGRAGKAVLYSVEQGLQARTDSGFSRHLVSGLNGSGRAKDWYNGELYVKFDFLWKYIESQSKRKVSQQIGESEGLILRIDPVPQVKFKIDIDQAGPDDHFQVVVRRQNAVILQQDIEGRHSEVKVDSPGMSSVDVVHGAQNLLRVEPAPGRLVELYDDDVALKYTRQTSALESAPLAADAPVTVLVARNAAVRITGPGVDELIDDDEESVTRDLAPGNYRISVSEAGQTVAAQDIRVERGTPQQLDPVVASTSPVQQAILAQMEQEAAREVWFSESLGGPTLDRDLGLWLAYLGAARIVKRLGDFSKLVRVPLTADFSDVQAGQSAVYLLASLEGQPNPYSAALGTTPVWREMIPVTDVPDLYELSWRVPPGPFSISFCTPGRPPLTASSCALPNRATLLTVSPSTVPSPVRLYQFMLPIWSLLDQLPYAVRARVDNEPLRVVRFGAHCQRLFAQEHSLYNAYIERRESSQDDDARDTYMELIYGKWMDPLSSIIAANDLLRRGVLNAASPVAQYRNLLDSMVRNLRKYFAGIPDIELLARAIGEPANLIAAPPLLADNIERLSIEERRRCLPFAESQRLFGSPWVAWANAVPPPA